MMIRPMLVDVRGISVHCPVLSMVDGRSSRPRTKQWLYTKSVELVLFGANSVSVPSHTHQTLLTLPFFPRHGSLLLFFLATQRTTGAFHVLLQKHSFDDAVFVCQKSEVVEGRLREEDFKTILSQFKPLIEDVESRNRVVGVDIPTHAPVLLYPILFTLLYILLCRKGVLSFLSL